MSATETIILISGRIGSGKTTLAHALASTLSLSTCSFSDEVREIAKQRGLGDRREDLQTVGEDLVRNHLLEFCQNVLARLDFVRGSGVVIDGLRHIEVLQTIRELVAPQRVWHIHIASPDELRRARILGRSQIEELTLNEIEQHSTERQLEESLPSVADTIVDGAQSTESIISCVLVALDSGNG